MYHHLTNGQRCQIYSLKKRKISFRSIARDLNVQPSTISREINRNSGRRGYRPAQAQLLADIKKYSSTSHTHKMTPDVLGYIQHGLNLQWSPEQISGRLLLDKGIRLSHERIYQYIWQDKKTGGALFKNLRRRGKKYNKRASKTAGRGLIPGRIDISCRPEVVDLKSRVGDWEADSVLGQQLGGGGIVTLCERKSLLVKIGCVRRRTSGLTQSMIIRLLSPVSRWVHTITYDNGKEFAEHATVDKKLGSEAYFAKPYHSWERGLNENTNGLIRQYLPKGMNLSKLTEVEVKRVEDLLNNRPRKTLKYLTPNEVFIALTKSQSVALRT